MWGCVFRAIVWCAHFLTILLLWRAHRAQSKKHPKKRASFFSLAALWIDLWCPTRCWEHSVQQKVLRIYTESWWFIVKQSTVVVTAHHSLQCSSSSLLSTGWSLAPQRQLSALALVLLPHDEASNAPSNMHHCTASLYLCSIKKQSILIVNWYQSPVCALGVCAYVCVCLCTDRQFSPAFAFQSVLPFTGYSILLILLLFFPYRRALVLAWCSSHTIEVVARRVHRTCHLMCRAISRWQSCTTVQQQQHEQWD